MIFSEWTAIKNIKTGLGDDGENLNQNRKD